MIELNINGKNHKVEAPDDMPLLWVLRDMLNLTGTKYGCGVASCGACTVHIDGVPMKTCTLPASAVQGQKITTIEAVGAGGMSNVQKAWIQHHYSYSS